MSGQSLRKQIKVNESHGYSFKADKDYSAQVVVESKGVDVALTLIAPDGRQISGNQDNQGELQVLRQEIVPYLNFWSITMIIAIDTVSP